MLKKGDGNSVPRVPVHVITKKYIHGQDCRVKAYKYGIYFFKFLNQEL
jgi:hypothetical protein